MQPPVRQAPPVLAVFSDDEDGDSSDEECLSPAARWMNNDPIDGLDLWYSTTNIKIDGMTYPALKDTSDQLLGIMQATGVTSIDQAELIAAECNVGPGCARLEVRFLFRGQPTVAGVTGCVRHLLAEAATRAAESTTVDEFSLMGAALAVAEISPPTFPEDSRPPPAVLVPEESLLSTPNSPRVTGTTVLDEMSRSRRKSRALGRHEPGQGLSQKCEVCKLWFGPKTTCCTSCNGTLLSA